MGTSWSRAEFTQALFKNKWGPTSVLLSIRERRLHRLRMANIPRRQGRAEPKIGPSDSSDDYADRPNEPDTDTDSAGTGESITVGTDPRSELHDETAPDRVVDESEAGLGGGLDQAEEARLKEPKKKP
jgi:hypothetical protein